MDARNFSGLPDNLGVSRAGCCAAGRPLLANILWGCFCQGPLRGSCGSVSICFGSPSPQAFRELPAPTAQKFDAHAAKLAEFEKDITALKAGQASMQASLEAGQVTAVVCPAAPGQLCQPPGRAAGPAGANAARIPGVEAAVVCSSSAFQQAAGCGQHGAC